MISMGSVFFGKPIRLSVDVAHGVGGGDGAESIGIVHDGREVVHALDQRQIVGHAVDARVVGGVGADEHRGIVGCRQAAQHLRQVLRT
jgi:hypothetical protein